MISNCNPEFMWSLFYTKENGKLGTKETGRAFWEPETIEICHQQYGMALIHFVSAL